MNPINDMLLSVTVDFPDDITKGPFDTEKLEKLIDTVQDLGASRLHWIYYGEVAADDPRRGNIWTSHWAAHGPKTIEALGEPLRAAVKIAKSRGLEIYGVLKPYNGGLAGSFPTGSPEAGSASRVTRIGGTLVQLIPFLESHPEMRIQRKATVAPTSSTGPIREIHLIKANADESRLRPADIRIWVSCDNHKYRHLDLIPTGTVSVEAAHDEVRDYHGNVLTRAGDPVRVIRLTGLEISEPFMALTTCLTEGSGDFRNTPLGMVKVFGADHQALEFVLATHAALWIKPRDFRTYGLEFDQGYGHLPLTLDEPWQPPRADRWVHFSGEDEFSQEALLGHGAAGGFIGIARGKNHYLSAAPCEAYPEVRSLWLSWIQAMLEAGVDGVDLRISAHGCLSDEPDSYGWNPPVLAAYRQRFGPEPVDAGKLAGVRGDFYSEFLREASALIRAEGKKLQVHLHAEAFRPDPVFGQQHGLPANIEFQWRRWLKEKLVDEILLRTSWFEAAEDPLMAKETRRSRLNTALADPIVKEMLDLAAKHGLPVTLNRYIGRAARLEEYLDDISSALKDGRISQFDVYEFFDLAQADPVRTGLIPKGDRLACLKARWSHLN